MGIPKRMPKPGIFYVVNVPSGTLVKVCGQNPDRRAITFYLTNQTPVSVSINAGEVDTSIGIRIDVYQPYLEICACHAGDIVTREWYVESYTDETNIVVIEGFDDPWQNESPSK